MFVGLEHSSTLLRTLRPIGNFDVLRVLLGSLALGMFWPWLSLFWPLLAFGWEWWVWLPGLLANCKLAFSLLSFAWLQCSRLTSYCCGAFSFCPLGSFPSLLLIALLASIWMLAVSAPRPSKGSSFLVALRLRLRRCHAPVRGRSLALSSALMRLAGQVVVAARTARRRRLPARRLAPRWGVGLSLWTCASFALW